MRDAGHALRRLAAGVRRAQGRPRGDHAAQQPAISGVPVRHAAGRRHRGQRQSALHRVGACAPVARLGRADHRGAGELRPHAGAGAAGHRRAQHRAHRHRRPAGRRPQPQGPRAELRDAPHAEAGAAAPPALADPAARRPGRRRHARAAAGAARPAGHRLPAIHRWHHRRGQGGNADPPQHRRQPAAGRGVVPGHAVGRGARCCRSITSSRSR